MPEADIQQFEAAEEAYEMEMADIENQQIIANQLAVQQQTEQERVAEEEEAAKNRGAEMSLGLFIPLIILCIIGDFIDVITGGTIGWLIGLFIDGIILLATGLSKAGRKQFKRIVVGLIGETIPIIDVLPFRTIFLTWGFIKSRSAIAASLSQKLPTAAKAVSKPA